MGDDADTVLTIERRRLHALVTRDMSTADELHHADYELISPGGRTYSKATYLADVASKRLEYLAFEPTGPVAVRATPEVVVLRYVARIRLSVDVDDEVEFKAWHTDHYERRDGRWQAVWSQATRVAD